MENQPVVKISFQQTRADFIDLWKATRFKHLAWIAYLIGLFYLYWAIAIFMNDGYTTQTASPIREFLFVAIFAISSGLIIPRIRGGVSLRGPVACEPRHIIASPQGVNVESSVFAATYHWSAFTHIKETKHSFILFTAPIVALILPKRSFSSSDELQQIRSLIQTHFPGKKQLLN